MMTEDRIGIAGRAALLASNLAVTAAIGFAACLAVVYG